MKVSRFAALACALLVTTGAQGEELHPMILGTYDTPNFARGVVVMGNVAYVTDQGAGLLIIDVSMPETPTLRGSVGLPGSARGVAVDGNYAFVAAEEAGLHVVDISDPTMPTLVGTVDTPGSAQSVVVSGAMAYVADRQCGLHVIDVIDPSDPVIFGSRSLPGLALDVAIAGDDAAVACFGAGVCFVDISMPMAPAIRDIQSSPARALSLTRDNGTVYVAAENSGLFIIDAGNMMTAPSVLGSVGTDGSAQSVRVRDGRAFVANFSDGMRIFNVEDPMSPEDLGGVDTPNSAVGIALDVGLKVYMADGFAGLHVICIPEAIACSTADVAPPFGVLDFSDVLAFLNAFDNHEASADLAQPAGIMDFTDMLTFLEAFGDGCYYYNTCPVAGRYFYHPDSFAECLPLPAAVVAAAVPFIGYIRRRSAKA